MPREMGASALPDKQAARRVNWCGHTSSIRAINSRLLGPCRRCGRWLPWVARLGTKVVGCRSGQVPPPIPAKWREWHVNVANAGIRAYTLSDERDRACLFRTLATLRTNMALFDDVDELSWNGPHASFEVVWQRLDAAVTKPKVRSRSA